MPDWLPHLSLRPYPARMFSEIIIKDKNQASLNDNLMDIESYKSSLALKSTFAKYNVSSL